MKYTNATADPKTHANDQEGEFEALLTSVGKLTNKSNGANFDRIPRKNIQNLNAKLVSLNT